LLDPVASLPLAIFFQFGTPYLEVQQRAYASAVILLVVILLLTTLTRLFSRVSESYMIK
jgi:phosphate transport system permease protein